MDTDAHLIAQYYALLSRSVFTSDTRPAAATDPFAWLMDATAFRLRYYY